MFCRDRTENQANEQDQVFLSVRSCMTSPQMADVVQEKSRGLKFAEQQLLRHGWEHGKGLGRAENGISEPVQVKVKCDKGGVGHKEGEQFSFHWWDHVFNKASASLQVETHQNEIKFKKTAEEGEEEEVGTISNKKPRKALLAKSKLYGCFVKSATLLSGQEQPEPKSSVSDDSSSSEEEEQKLDLSSTTKLSDSDLMKACGGRTAHKGARHGLTMSAKLARLEQQEAEFMAECGKKSQQTRSSSVCVAPTPPTVGSEPTEERRREKSKKKKSTKRFKELNEEEARESAETEVQPKKKKRKDKTKDRLPAEGDRNCKIRNGDEGAVEETEELNSDSKLKKKKKSLKNDVKTPEEEGESIQSDDRTQEEAEVTVTTEKQKRKRSKKDKLLTEKSDDVFPPKKKTNFKLMTN